MAANPFPQISQLCAQEPERTVILVAEDELLIMKFISAVLRSDGYRIIAASSATEAKQQSDEFDGDIDLLLTDHTLRDGKGREVADHIMRKRPKIRVLQMSGHPHCDLERDGQLLPGGYFLAKPFGPPDLRKAVARIFSTR